MESFSRALTLVSQNTPALCFSAGDFVQIESLETLLPAPHLEIRKRHCNNKRARSNNDFLPVVTSQQTARSVKEMTETVNLTNNKQD